MGGPSWQTKSSSVPLSPKCNFSGRINGSVLHSEFYGICTVMMLALKTFWHLQQLDFGRAEQKYFVYCIDRCAHCCALYIATLVLCGTNKYSMWKNIRVLHITRQKGFCWILMFSLKMWRICCSHLVCEFSLSKTTYYTRVYAGIFSRFQNNSSFRKLLEV